MDLQAELEKRRAEGSFKGEGYKPPEDPLYIKIGLTFFIIIASPIWIPLFIVGRPILAIRRRLKKHSPAPLKPSTLDIPKEPPRPLDPELLRRRELAKQTNKFNHPKIRHLYDPLRDDPAYSAIIEAAAQRAQDEVGHPHVLGTCHLIWRRQKQILKEEFGIVWYTPSEMNPRVIYD